MPSGKDYVREIQKFTTSQYWNTGVRITAGVMLPTILLVRNDWLGIGMPFLWGAMFVSLTDSPGPIHHRRNGMLVAILLNTITALLIGASREIEPLLIVLVIAFSFFYSLLGVYGARAGAVGTLALVIMLINLVPNHADVHFIRDSALIAGGGIWYMLFSLMLYRLRPYRLVEQAIGENLIAMAEYVRARGGFYKPDADVQASFNKLIEEQVTVLKIQDHTRELIFKTRQFVTDPSPKSRSLMMIFLDSVDLLEQTLSSYQDYSQLQENLRHTELLERFHQAVLQLAGGLEQIGIAIQSGQAVEKQIDMTRVIRELGLLISDFRHNAKDTSTYPSLDALQKTLFNMNNISKRMHRLVLYTRLEVELDEDEDPSTWEINKTVASQSLKWEVIQENLTLKSNHFRYAIRLTLAMLAGYAVSMFFLLGHTYWVLLTIVTILKPVYAVSRKRNIQRLSGTLVGALAAIVLLNFITNSTALVTTLVLCMILGYSLLRVNYFGFVFFLTIYIIITFHFLNPLEFKTLIQQRLVDTLVGSVIAGLAARFVLPVWGRTEIETSMREMLAANHHYFTAALQQLHSGTVDIDTYKVARKEAMVALTNLSDNFQHMLAEPQTEHAIPVHQFVIASHMLNGHIAALITEKYSLELTTSEAWVQLVEGIEHEFTLAETQLQAAGAHIKPADDEKTFPTSPSLSQLSMIYMLVRDIRIITDKK